LAADDLPTDYLSLTSDSPQAMAQWRILDSTEFSLRLEFRLPALRVRTIDGSSGTWQELTIDRGGLQGAVGAPGLPTAGRLIAIPAGATVSARVIDFHSRRIDDLRLAPVQAGASESLQSNPVAYGKSGWQGVHLTGDEGIEAISARDRADASAAPTVLLGQPALMAGQTVVPVTVGPVVYDPVARAAWIADRIEVELRFDAASAEGALESPVSRRTAPGPAFSTLLTAGVMGMDADRAVVLPGEALGTWAVVCRNTLSQQHVQPLIDWRARQGYHVEVVLSEGTPASIKSELQVVYDDAVLPPLEFILIVGDTESPYRIPTWNETLSGYGGEGDHYYATLDGDDILADAHVGRLSCRTLSGLDVVVDKILNYEQSPPMTDLGWYRKGCVIGDPNDSGITTVWVNQWLKGQLLANAYTAVDTIWSGNFVGQMMASVNAGVSAMGYRGFWNMSGITPGHIEALSNGRKLPVAILPTCDTGSFEGSYTCHSEAFLRAPNGGAIAAIATATPGTHTRYNNCYYQGTWDGLLNASDPRIGAAHTLGKIELYNNYYLAEPDRAEIWAVWNNIMGDPASQIWMSVPQLLSVEYPDQISVGAGAVEFRVRTDGLPVSDALVCLHRDGEFQVAGRTDAAGSVLLVVPPLAAGSVQVTVTGEGLHPYLGGLQIGTVDRFCGLSDLQIDDDSDGSSAGNGDGQVNPGETVELTLAVTNHGTGTAFGVSGSLEDSDPWSTVESAEVVFGEVAPQVTQWSAMPAVVSIDPSTPDGTILRWPLQVTDGIDNWMSVALATVEAADLRVSDITWGGGTTFEPGQSGPLVFELTNDGSIAAGAVSAELSCESGWLEITGNPASFNHIGAGASGSNGLDPFLLSISPDCYGGHLALLRLDIEYSDGMLATAEVPITVGTAETTDPTGPDSYGYYAFDNTDTDSWCVPTYEWVALDPDHGGSGTDLGLTDFGWEEDDTKTVPLPFPFQYYGVEFDEISICSNGWLAMGETPLLNYRNFSIPAKGSPGSLIAPFWDNLYQSGARKVYTHYDESEHRYIIQWYNLMNDYSSANQNFEVILLDPVWHPTATGDGIIVFQYNTVNNTDSRDGYATVGLQNHDRTDGLLYTYWNQYSPGAAPLTSGRAIVFQPLGALQLPAGSVSPEAFQVVLEPGEQEQQTLHLSNVGAEGSYLHYTIETVDPATFPDGEPDKSIQGSEMTFTVDSYEPGTTVDVEVAVHTISTGFLTVVQLQMPAGVTLNTGENLSNTELRSTLFWREQVGEGVLTTWDGYQDGYLYYLPDGSTVTATLNMTFATDLVGELEFAYRLEDEGIYSPPDQVLGTIRLTNDLPSVRVVSPDAGTVAVIGHQTEIQFDVYNASDAVDIALQREPDGPWTTLAMAVDATRGSWAWTVTGEPGPHAVIRINDSQDPAVYDLSEEFVVSRDLQWLQLAQTAGTVDSGQTAEILFTIDATGLESGAYQAVLVIHSNAGESILVPVDLTVRGVSATGDETPRSVSLLGNYPNPFNPNTTVSFTLPRDMDVTLDVYSTRGQLVQRLLVGSQRAGVHHAVWDGTDSDGHTVASGVYLYRLVTPDRTLSDKMVLAK